MKNILLIAILFLTSLVAKAEDYYDIPAGWEKVVEFESNLSNLNLVANNKLIYLGSLNLYSTNGGLTFDSLKLMKNVYGTKAFFINDDLFLPGYFQNNSILYKVILFNNQVDTLKNSNSNYIYGNFDLIHTCKNTSNIGLSYLDGKGIMFSIDNGNTWESKKFSYTKCYYKGDNYYNLLFDCSNPNRWIYFDYFTSDWCSNWSYFITDDNGLNFRKIEKPKFNIKISSQEKYNSDNSFTDKYFGFDNSNSAISINYIKIENPKKQYPYFYFLNNGFKFIDINDSQKDRSFNMDSIMANYLKVDSVYEGAVSIDKDYYLTKDNKILFMSYDKLPSNSKDTIFQKMFLFDYKTMKLEQLLDRKISLVKDANFYSNSILHFDYNGGYVYYDLTAPQKPNELQKKIIIRRKIQDATSIETESEKLESICLQDGKIVFEKEYQNPTIEIIDIVGKSLDYKILSNNPLTIEPNPNTTKGAYFLKIKDNQKEKNYKFIFE